MVRAAVSTLDKVWRAGIDLSREKHPRLQALRTLEEDVLRRLPPSHETAERAGRARLRRIGYAKAVLGPIEVHGHSEMSPCWRPLLRRVERSRPGHLDRRPAACSGLATTRRKRKSAPKPAERSRSRSCFSCANPQHEAVEAFRWMRELLATGTARPEEIAIAAASPADFDDHVLALSRDGNIPVHFVHGIKAVTGRDGQMRPRSPKPLLKASRRNACGACLRSCTPITGACGICRATGRASCRRMRRSPPWSDGNRFSAEASRAGLAGRHRSVRIVLDVLRLARERPGGGRRGGREAAVRSCRLPSGGARSRTGRRRRCR